MEKDKEDKGKQERGVGILDSSNSGAVSLLLQKWACSGGVPNGKGLLTEV